MKRSILTMSMIFGLAVLFCGSSAEAAFEEGIGIQIPVIVNLYPGCGTTEAKAKEAIEEANKLMKQAGFKLVVVDVNDAPADDGGDDGSGGGTANDGEFTPDERDKIRTFGGKELKKLKNEKGIKISFGKNPVADTNDRGVSIHRNPTIIVRESTAAEGGPADTGQTIAHELGHVLTLDAGHKVEDANDDGDYDDPGERADAGAHSSGADHIMQATGKGDKFTKDQIEEMKKEKYKHGKCSVQWNQAYPAEKVKLQYGATTDALGDHIGLDTTTSPMYDIDRVVLTSLAGPDHLGTDYCTMDVQFTVAGTLTFGEIFFGEYVLGFDIDADATTGFPLSVYEGIDRIVKFRVSSGMVVELSGVEAIPPIDGPIDIVNPLYVYGEVVNLHTNQVTPLPEMPIAVVDDEFDAGGVATPAATSILAKVPKCTLALTAPQVPVVAVSRSGSIIEPGPFDPIDVLALNGGPIIIFPLEYDHTDDLVFDQQRWLGDPSLRTFGNGVPEPGQPYEVEVFGLLPDSEFTLYLNDTPVLTGVLDSGGHTNADFTFPAELPNTEMHFLTAQDTTGEFAYGITCWRMVRGDVNGDNKVDWRDIAVIGENWLDGVY